MFAVLIVHFYDYRKQETFQTMSIFKANISVLLIIIIILKSKKMTVKVPEARNGLISRQTTVFLFFIHWPGDRMLHV